MELYPDRDTIPHYTFVFDQGHMTKNQPITVLVLLSESLGIQQYIILSVYIHVDCGCGWRDGSTETTKTFAQVS